MMTMLHIAVAAPSDNLWDLFTDGVRHFAVIMPLILTLPLFLVWLERKVSARIQARLGPTRVGPAGVLQTFADMMKLLFKEIITPSGADRVIFYLAPLLPITATCLVLPVIPFSSTWQIADPELGVIYVLGISGLGIFGVLLAGWASNNKFSLLGALRCGAQMISYEISIAMLILFVVMMSGETSLHNIVVSQQGTVLDWWVFKVPGLGLLAFCLYIISSTAELNRGPFDIAEAEQELTAGFHTEYAGMGFAMFFLAEFVNLSVAAFLGTIFFLGGYLAPQFGWDPLDRILAFVPEVIWFNLKSMVFIMIYMLLRWTYPRPRVDQLLALEWKVLLPINLCLLVVGGLFIYFGWIL